MGYLLILLLRNKVSIFKRSLKATIFLLALLLSTYIQANETSILIIRPEGNIFKTISLSIIENLEESFNVQHIIVTTAIEESTLSDAYEIKRQIEQKSPAVIVLMNNTALNAYLTYQKNYPKSFSFPPSIAVAALHVSTTSKKVTNNVSIAYEIPIVVSTTHLRTLMKNPLKQVAVIHRSWMKQIIELQAQFTKLEEIKLVSYELPNTNKNTAKKIKKILSRIEKDQIDAVWIPNDNVLINADTILFGWIPGLKKINLPVIVGVPSLIQTSLNFGTLAVYPDHYAIGGQVANMIWDIIDANNGQLPKHTNQVIQPWSFQIHLNKKLSIRKGIQLHQDRLDQVDKIIE